jgi:hypothetical protein
VLILKKLWRWLVFYTIVFVLLFSFPGDLHRRDFDRAFFAWRKSPNPQTEATLRVEQRKNEVYELGFVAISSTVIVGTVTGLYGITRFAIRVIKRRRSSAVS